jgi:hypothetical protein
MRTLIPAGLLLTALSLLASCAPTTQGPDPFAFADQTFAKDQKWVVEAKGGDKTEVIEFVLQDRSEPIGRNVFFRNTTYSGVNYFHAHGDEPESIAATWKSDTGVSSSCAIRHPSSAADRTVFKGAYTRSLEREGAYLRTGDTTGTGICTLKRVQ